MRRMTETMRALAADSIGSTSNLRVTEVAAPVAGRGEVRVRVDHSALNPADWKVVTGATGAGFIHAKSFPLVVGYDVSGTIDAVGEGVNDLSVGDEVFGHLAYAGSQKQGAFAERVTIGASAVAKKPASVSHEAAAASATAGLTALQAMRDVGRVRADDRVLIIGASGGVGSLAVGIAKRLGAKVTAVCSTDSVGFVRELGADDVVDRKTDEIGARGGDYRMVFDTPNASSFGQCSALLASGGTYVATLPSFAFVTGKVASLLSSKRCAFVVVESKRTDLEQLARWTADGLTVPIESRHLVKNGAAARAAAAVGSRCR
jgi:NADPH:quinone reductase-like Zn-dependent oxidoreductase